MKSTLGAGGRALTMGLAALMSVQAILGRLFPGEYRDPEPIATTWIGNDWVTLLLAVPLFLVGFQQAERGSVRGRLLWGSIFAYGLYYYAFYLFGTVLSRFFLLYVLLLLLSILGLVLMASGLDVVGVARAFRPRTPVRFIGGALTFVGTGLGLVWIGMWAAYAFAGRPTPITPEAFKIVAALDLTLMVPALLSGGILLWQRRPWGYVIATLASVQGALYLLVLTVNSVLIIRRGLADPPGELPIWGGLGLLTAGLATLLLVNVTDGSSPTRGADHADR